MASRTNTPQLDSNGRAAPPTRRRYPLRSIVGGGLVGALLVAAVWGAYIVGWRRDATTPLTLDDLERAEQVWREQAPADYKLEVEISGRQQGVFQVEVRNGVVVGVTRNGVAPARHTWDTWSVPGQFDTLDRELENAQDPARGFGAPTGSQVVLRAEFDPQFGYPRRYARAVLGTPLEIAWRVTRFEPGP